MVFKPSKIEEKPTEKKEKISPLEKKKIEEEKMWREKELIEMETALEEGLVSVRDLIAPAAMQITPRYLILGNKYARTIFVTAYPRYIAVGWFASIINYNAPLDISMFFYPVHAAIILKQLQRKVGILYADISMEREKGMPRDPVKETALGDIEKLRDDLTQGVEHFFQFSLYVTFYADSEKDLDLLTEKIEGIFGSKLVYTKRVFYQAEQGFNATLPLGNDELMITFNMQTSPCASSFPFISADVTSDKGILYGINRHNNSLILFDRFSLENYNSVLFATSGAGKSVIGSEPVLIKDEEGKIQLTKIGPLIENLIKKKGLIQIDEEMEGVINPEIEVWSFDKNLKGEWSKVTVSARKKAPDILYQFKTRSGRKITTTGDHNMLILKNGRIVATKSEEIKEGDFVPLPRKIIENDNFPAHLNLLELLKNSPRIYLQGGEKILDENYQILKKAKINQRYDRYLYKYRQGRLMPIKYFFQILDYLKRDLKDEEIEKIKICSCKGGKSWPAILKIIPEFLRILGYIVSEGTTGENFVLISNRDEEVRKDISNCLKKINLTYHLRRSDRTFGSSDRVFVELVKILGATGKSHEKRVPPFIFSLSNKNKAEFLKAYFEGDGGVEKHEVSAVSKSQRLISDISYFFYYFGIVARISEIKKKNSGWQRKKKYYRLVISGQENLRKFAENINFISQKKKELLAQIINKQGNTNIDIIPETKKIFGEIYQLFSSQLYGIKEVSDFKNGFRHPSRERLKNVIEKIEERIRYFKNLKEKFAILEKLPSVSEIIDLAKNNKDLNKKLWQELSLSWPVMKNRIFEPRSANAFKALNIINGNPPSLPEVKALVHSGFKETGLLMKNYSSSLSSALNSFKSNTSYKIIQEASKLVWQNYQKILADKIPQIEEKLTQLKILADSDLFWDSIIKIKKIKNRDKYVYDLTVDNEVFLAGYGGMFVHNSYSVKLEVLRSMMIGTDVIIIDPEREYKHLCEAVGGTYIDVSLSSESKINPFDLPRPKRGVEMKVADVIRSAVVVLKGLLKIMIGVPGEKGQKIFTPEEDSLLDRALLETYAKKDIIPGCDLNKVEMPTLTDLQEILEGMAGGENLAERLKKYTVGTFAGLLNHLTNVELDNQLVVFSVRDLEDELRPIAIYTIVNYIWNVVRSELKKRILVIDEAWWLMQYEDSARFIFSLVKRCRKYYLGVTTITQDVSDFLISDYGRAIVTNSALKILFKQTPAAIDIVSKTFMLTEGERYLLLECGVGEGIFFAGSRHAAMQVVASYTEDQLITSDPRQLLEIEAAKREYAESLEEESPQVTD